MAKGKKAYTQDLQKKSVKELVKMRQKLQKEWYGAKMKHAMRGLKQTHTIRELKRNIARINTVLTAKIKEQYGDANKTN